MSLERFISNALSPWMKEESGAEKDIVLSTRIRFARNLNDYPFPIISSEYSAETLRGFVSKELTENKESFAGSLELLNMEELSKNEKKIDRKSVV